MCGSDTPPCLTSEGLGPSRAAVERVVGKAVAPAAHAAACEPPCARSLALPQRAAHPRLLGLHLSVLSRVHAAYAVVKDRAERAEVRLEMAESALEQERCSGDAYKVCGRGRAGQWSRGG